jgi:hypothetical protein
LGDTHNKMIEWGLKSPKKTCKNNRNHTQLCGLVFETREQGRKQDFFSLQCLGKAQWMNENLKNLIAVIQSGEKTKGMCQRTDVEKPWERNCSVPLRKGSQEN